MSDTIQPKAHKSTPMNPVTPVEYQNPLGLNLGEFRLGEAECAANKQGRTLVTGIEIMLFDQCSDQMNTPLLHLKCDDQTKDGVTIDLKAETGEISTNCPDSMRTFLKKETMSIEVSLSAVALANPQTIGFLEGRETAANGNIRGYGFGAIRYFTLVLVDRESMTAAIYPNAHYMPSSIQIKRSYDSEPSSKIMFNVSKADIGDGRPFFYEVRSISPSANLIAA